MTGLGGAFRCHGTREGEVGSAVWGFLFVFACLLLMACNDEHATEEDCAVIFERIVELELREMGYADPELLERKGQALKTRYHRELDSCVGKAIPADALSCVARARSTEELSHECMK